MTSYGYIIMIIIDLYMIWFHFDCIMQLNKSYHIATNVCSKKSVTTFGALPDCLSTAFVVIYKYADDMLVVVMETSATISKFSKG